MKALSLKNGKMADSMILAVVLVATVYWVLDSVLNIFFTNQFNLIAQLIGPDLYDVYIRVVVLCLLVILGSHAQSIINRLNQAKQNRMGNGKVKTVKIPPLKRQLTLVTKDEPSKELQAVIKYLQSKDAKKLFK